MEATLRVPFVPVYAPAPAPAAAAAVLGGTTVLLHAAEPWPRCATCAHAHVPLLLLDLAAPATPAPLRAHAPPAPAGARPFLQLLVCPADACFDHSTTYATEHRSWFLRIAHFTPAEIDAALAARADRTREAPARRPVRDTLLAGALFLPERLVRAWAPGAPETADYEVADPDGFDEDFYAAHEPDAGFKLLGHPVRGKFYCGELCDKQSPGCRWRDLVQLGSIHSEHEEDSALAQMATLGNSWIAQCEQHPDVLQLIMSGNW